MKEAMFHKLHPKISELNNSFHLNHFFSGFLLNFSCTLYMKYDGRLSCHVSIRPCELNVVCVDEIW